MRSILGALWSMHLVESRKTTGERICCRQASLRQIVLQYYPYKNSFFHLIHNTATLKYVHARQTIVKDFFFFLQINGK